MAKLETTIDVKVNAVPEIGLDYPARDTLGIPKSFPQEGYVVGTVWFSISTALSKQLRENADVRELVAEDVKRRVRKLLETIPE